MIRHSGKALAFGRPRPTNEVSSGRNYKVDGVVVAVTLKAGQEHGKISCYHAQRGRWYDNLRNDRVVCRRARPRTAQQLVKSLWRLIPLRSHERPRLFGVCACRLMTNSMRAGDIGHVYPGENILQEKGWALCRGENTLVSPGLQVAPPLSRIGTLRGFRGSTISLLTHSQHLESPAVPTDHLQGVRCHQDPRDVQLRKADFVISAFLKVGGNGGARV